MALQSVPCLDAFSSLDVFSDGWRTAVGQIEAEFYSGEVYQHVLTSLEAKVGELTEEAQALVKTVSREAICLTLQRLNHQQSRQDGSIKAADEKQPISGVPVSAAFPVSLENTKQLASRNAVRATAKSAKKASKKGAKIEAPLLARVAQLQQLGQYLRRIRQSRSLTLQQLHELTLVPLHQIQALEAGQIDRLPEDIYVRGFIRRISEALGLDSNQIVQSIPAPDPAEGLLPSWARSAQPEFYLRPIHLYLGYAALMAGAMGGLNYLSQQSISEINPNALRGLPFSALPQILQDQANAHSSGKESTQASLVTGLNVAPPESLIH